MVSSTSIWNSIEVYCASRDFGYDQYLSAHMMANIKAAPLSRNAYAAVSDVIHASIKDEAITEEPTDYLPFTKETK